MDKTLQSRLLTGATLAAITITLGVSGAFGGFWRTLDGLTSNGVPSPSSFLYGQGIDDNGFAFGYGYGYGYGTYAAGYGVSSSSSSTSSSSSSSSSSSGGGGGGGGSSSGIGISSSSSSSSTSGGSSTSSSSSSSTSSSSSGGSNSSYTPRTYEDQPKIATCGQSIVAFSDIAGTTFEDYIIALEKISGLNGNGKGADFNYGEPESKSFQPNRSTTRAEYVKMVLRALCIDYSDENSTFDNFSDSSEEWQAKVVNKAVELGWLSTSNATFRPNDTITRAEALKMVMQAAGAPTSEVNSSSFTDVDASSWVARYTEAAKGYGIINGQMINGKLMFRPSDSIKRGESTKLIMKSLFVPGM